ncbi:hypothetical protein LTQ03_00035 [Vibrio splendidus]|uniref:hypothetical protein n=1 Tax=Vibrio splendidus TaxID=29497 RepID=UPI000C8397AE|nr:hypothetical protein [Vibrio splendidus]UOE79862.1 hypothetical protein LTQ03_00035 [Vibrio splendidus]
MKPNRSTGLTGHIRHCPCCSTELVIKDHIHVCPRNEIGDCYFDGYDQHEQRANTDFIDHASASDSLVYGMSEH